MRESVGQMARRGQGRVNGFVDETCGFVFVDETCGFVFVDETIRADFHSSYAGGAA